jgi:hypothetical protein
MYNNDPSLETNAQLYEREGGQGNNNKSESSISEIESGERLSRQESYELREAIRKYVPAHLEEQEGECHQGRITVSDVMQKFEKCKEGFARGQLNELVEDNILIAQQIQGIKVYFLAESEFQIEHNHVEDSTQVIDESLAFIDNESNSAQYSQIEIMAELLEKAIDKIAELENRLIKLEKKPAPIFKQLDRDRLLGKLKGH